LFVHSQDFLLLFHSREKLRLTYVECYANN
ncbi:MAG: hypothetical protein ACI85I_001667, partial [Arenicella sp.]